MINEELKVGDVTEIKIIAPDYVNNGNKENLLKLAIISDSSFNQTKQVVCFVDETCTCFVDGIGSGGTTGASVAPWSIKKFEDLPEYKFVKFYEP